MRTIIAVEGTPTLDGRYITPGALVWAADVTLWTLPGLTHERELVGQVEEIQREDDGKITGEIRLAEDFTPQMTGLAIELDDMEWVDDDDVITFTRGRIRAVSLVAWPAWPEAKLTCPGPVR